MKTYYIRILFIIFILMILTVSDIQALEPSRLIAMRTKIFRQSEEIKPFLAGSRDAVLISSMWDSCLVTISQLDAYFFMIGILNTIQEKDITAQALDYIEKWLDNIKNTNDINIKSLNSVSYEVEPSTKIHMRKMKDMFGELNQAIENETKKIKILNRKLQVR